MAYFDATQAYDVNLLADAVKADTRLIPMAAAIERELVNRYTDLLKNRPLGADYSNVFELSDGVRGVFLRGYDSDGS